MTEDDIIKEVADCYLDESQYNKLQDQLIRLVWLYFSQLTNKLF